MSRGQGELNAMTTPQFVEWLDRKMAPYDNGKVIPPRQVLQETLNQKLKESLTDRAVEEWLRTVGERQVEQEFESLRAAVSVVAADLDTAVEQDLEDDPTSLWSQSVENLVLRILEQATTTATDEGKAA